MRFVFICSNEQYNAGFRDYAMSLCFELRADGEAPLACKIGGNPEHESGLAALEPNNVSYSVLPAFDKEAFFESLPLDEHCVVLGLGEPTLDALIEVHDANQIHSLSFGFVSHQIELGAQEALRTRAVTAFTRSQDVDMGVDHIHIDAVPHTATEEILRHHAGQMAIHGDERIAEILNLRKDFAVAVLNAGFEVETPEGHKKYVPYTAEEAFEHGAALGHLLKPDTELILVDGGPRNLRDIDAGEDTGLAFHAGYHDANNNQSFRTDFIYERFEPGLPYNAVFGAMYLAHERAECRAFISNAEGYGTMEAARLHIDNQQKLLSMYPFRANAEDITGERLANIVEYGRRGISILDWPDYMNGLVPPQKTERTPVSQVNASRLIIETFKGVPGGPVFAPGTPGF